MYKNLLIKVAIVWLIFLSLVPRIAEVLNKNPIFLLDQGRDFLAVRNIIVDHKLTLIGAEVGSGMAGLSGLFHGPFYFYFLSIPTLFFSGDPYGGLLLMFLFGLLTIVMGFILGRMVFGVFGGLLLALLIALSPPLIAQSRFVWSPHPSSFFILIAFYFIYLISPKKYLYIFLAAFFSGFVYNFEIAIVVPMSISLLLYIIFVLKLRQFKHYLALFGGFSTAFSPFILFEFRHGFTAFRGVAHYFVSSQIETIFQFERFVQNVNWFFYILSDSFPKQNIFPFALVFLISIAMLIYFILKEKKSNVKAFLFYLLSLIGVTFIIDSFIRTHIFEYYLIHLNFVYLFLFSYIVVNSHVKNVIRFKFILGVFLITLILSGTVNAIRTFKEDLYDYGGMVKIKGKIDAIDYIYNNAHGERFGLLIFSPPIYTYPYDYLLWWHGQRKYNYLPHQDKSGLFYLLIEKDVAQPWSYQGWLETVIRTGKTLETIELPSGFIIQKRFGGDKNAI